jgi:hypothetical protein
MSGTTKPSGPKREILKQAYGVDVGAWDDETITAAVALSPPLSQRPPRVRGRASAEDLEEAIDDCNRLLELADAAGGSVRDRSGLLATKVGAIAKLIRVRGEDALTLERFRKTKDWKDIVRAIEEGLRGHPEAAAAVHRELAKALGE